MRTIYTVILICFFAVSAFSQKMLVLERANRAKTTKMYVGESLRFRLKGPENYWYDRTITDILPESNTLLLDNFAVKLDSIVQIKVRRKPIVRLLSGTIFTFGASLAFATTIAALYRDDGIAYAGLYGTAAGSMGLGLAFSTPRKLKLGKRHRLRIIEIRFPDPLIPPPPVGVKKG